MELSNEENLVLKLNSEINALTEVSPQVQLLGSRAPFETSHSSSRRSVNPVLLVAQTELPNTTRLRSIDVSPQLLETSVPEMEIVGS